MTLGWSLVARGVGRARNVIQPKLKLGPVIFEEVRLSVSSGPRCHPPAAALKAASPKHEIGELE